MAPPLVKINVAFTSSQKWNVIIFNRNISDSGKNLSPNYNWRLDKGVLNSRQTSVQFLKSSNFSWEPKQRQNQNNEPALRNYFKNFLLACYSGHSSNVEFQKNIWWIQNITWMMCSNVWCSYPLWIQKIIIYRDVRGCYLSLLYTTK